MGRLSAVMWLVVALGCQPEQRSVATDDAGPTSVLPTASLQVPPERLTRIEVTQPGKQPVALELADGGGWRITSPLAFPANQDTVAPMVAVLAELEIHRRVADAPKPKHRLDESSGVQIRASSTDGTVRAFTVGAAAGEATYVQRAGESQVFAVRGRCRHLLDKSLEQLRDATVTKMNLRAIEGVVFENQFGVLHLVPAPNGDTFVEKSPATRNFNGERASKTVAVVAGLRAKGFVDAPLDKPATGLFDTDTARATVSLRGEPEPTTVWIGARTTDGRLHVRTSDSEQVYLVSRHLGSSLIPQRRHFERSDEHMRELQLRPAAHPEEATSSADHDHGTALPLQVPPALMGELRDLARAQRR